MRRIAFDGDEIGEQSDSHSSNLVLHVKHTCVDRSCRAQRVDYWHSPGHHRFDLSGVVPMRKDADVAAAGNSHTCVERLFKNDLLLVDIGTACDRKGWTQRRAAFFHQTKEFRRETITMLYRFDARENCAARSFRTGRVR